MKAAIAVVPALFFAAAIAATAQQSARLYDLDEDSLLYTAPQVDALVARLATTNDLAAAIAAIPAPDYGFTNAIYAAISAAEPGDYAVVSNAAMTALRSYAETDPAWESEKAGYAKLVDLAAATNDLHRSAVNQSAVVALTSTNYTDGVASETIAYLDGALENTLASANAYTEAATANVAASSVPIPDDLTDIDAHGDAHNGPVEIGVGAKATADLSGVKAGSVVRSVSVAIGDGADAVDEANPAKQQAIAIGNQSRAAAVNAIAIGSGVRHEDETDMTGGNAYAASAQAVAIGYNAKATAANAWQLGSGVNDEPNTLKFGNTTIVRNGEVVGAVKERDIEKVVQKRVLENGYSTLTQGVTTNGYIYARFDSYRASDDTDHAFYIYANTNANAAAPLSIPSVYGNIDIYSGATVDAKLDALAVAVAERTAIVTNRFMDIVVSMNYPDDSRFANVIDVDPNESGYGTASLLVGEKLLLFQPRTTNSMDRVSYGQMPFDSVVLGYCAVSSNDVAFVWSGGTESPLLRYGSHGSGTFNINPFGGLSGFYIGDKNFPQHMAECIAPLLERIEALEEKLAK